MTAAPMPIKRRNRKLGVLAVVGESLSYGNTPEIRIWRPSRNICFVDSFLADLIGCVCNVAGRAIRKGFVDKAAAVPQHCSDLAYRASP